MGRSGEQGQRSDGRAGTSSGAAGGGLRAGAALAALGVVFGDIGTSPLYAFEACFRSDHPAPAEVLGVFSLVFWTLLLVVSVKYLAIVLRADNDGEGGILALLARLEDPERSRDAAPSRLALLALFGAALLYGDGLITPAISVLSAVEGLEVAAPSLASFVVPITILVLLLLFRAQRHGTAGVASVFGPTMLVWFVTIGGLGAAQLLGDPGAAWHVLAAIDPRHALFALTRDGLQGFTVVGSLVLVITGVEALYADLGHFGAGPIRRAWYAVAYPGLLLNYAGQAALVLGRGQVGEHTFYDLAPSMALLPLVGLSTLATIIASQALISGVFSLTEQASQLGYVPRLRVVHTSDSARGQIYLPHVNTALAGACIAIVLGFRSSDALAAAYGVAVTGCMAVTSVLLFFFVRRRAGWSLPRALLVVGCFLAIDLAFLAGNLGKIASGGWVPLAVAALLFTVMTTWARGRREVSRTLTARGQPLGTLQESLATGAIERIPGTAVYWTLHPDAVPPVLARNLSANHVLHERVVLLTVLGADVPRLPARKRARVADLGSGLHQAVVQIGFAEETTLPAVLEACEAQGLQIDLRESLFFLARYVPVPTGSSGMAPFRKLLYAFLSRNSPDIASSLEVPLEGAVEIVVPVVI